MAKSIPKVPTNPRRVRVQPVKLTNAVKIREIKRMVPRLLKAQGLIDSVVLTVRAPFVANVADCEFKLPGLVSAREDFVDFEELPPSDSVFTFPRPKLIVNLKVFHANKAHLLTIYVHSSSDQAYVVTNNKTGNDHLEQTVELQSGHQPFLFAFVPTKAGQQQFSFGAVRTDNGTSQFDFFRAEIDVLT